jgi:hypothetical protein
MARRDWLHWGTVTGEEQTVNGIKIRPQSWALRLTTPWGGFVHNRAESLLVEKDGVTQEVAVIDVWRRVRLALIILWVMAVAVRLAVEEEAKG